MFLCFYAPEIVPVDTASAFQGYGVEGFEQEIISRRVLSFLATCFFTRFIEGMVQAWVGQKHANVTFYKFFDVGFHKYLRR